MKKKYNLFTYICVLGIVVLFSKPVFSHGVWLANRSNEIQLVLGEGPKDDAYSPDMVKSVKGYDSKLQSVDVSVTEHKNYVVLNNPNKASVVSVFFDYGYWSNGKDGKWHNLPMSEVEGATIGTHAIKYSISYLGNVDKPKAIDGIPYQIVPSTDPTKLNVGDEFEVQFLKDGVPMPNIDVITDVVNHHTIIKKTDANGKLKVTVANGGLNVIGAEIAYPYKKKTLKATQDKVFVSLSFTIYPKED